MSFRRWIFVAAAVCVAACGDAGKAKSRGSRTPTAPPPRELGGETSEASSGSSALALSFQAASYFGGSDADVVDGMALDATGAVVIAINTRTSAGAGTGMVMKLDPALSAAVWSKSFPGPVKLARAPDGTLVVGVTTDADLPTTEGALQAARNPSGASGVDVYLAKLASGDGAVLWATYLGGPDHDTVTALTVGPEGVVYVAGEALFFPTTEGAFQETFAGWAVPAYVAAVSADGAQLLAATYLSGNQSGYETPTAIAADRNTVAVAGFTSGDDFPTTADAYEPTTPRAGANFFAVLNPTLSTLRYATYVGTAAQPLRQTVVFGAHDDIFLAASGAGTGCRSGSRSAGFVMRLTLPSGAFEPVVCLAAQVNVYAHGLAIDPSGRLIVSGAFAADATLPVPAATGLPLTGNAYDKTFASNEAFLGVFSSQGATQYFTYLGGSRADFSTGLTLGPGGAVYVRGRTASFDFPVTPGAYKTWFSAPELAWAEEGYVAKFVPAP